MKKWMLGLIILTLAVPAMAQVVGLPIASGAAAPEAGLFRGSAGIVVGDDVNLYGGRVTFAPIDGLALFGDVGLVDWDESGIKTGYGVQGGALFTLPLDLPVDVALRASAGMAKADLKGRGDVTWLTLNGGILASVTIEQFTPYAYLGVSYVDFEVDQPGYGKFSDDDTDPALGVGVIFDLTDQVSFYAEFMHIDDPFFGVGGRYRF